MPENRPSWDDVLAGTPLNMEKILETIHKAVGALPSGFGAEELAAVIEGNVAQAFSIENLLAAKAKVATDLVAFFAAGGSGPVEKSPTDLV